LSIKIKKNPRILKRKKAEEAGIKIQNTVRSGLFIYLYPKKPGMRIERNISLKKYNTFGLDYKAMQLVHLETVNEASAFFRERKEKDKTFIIGGGSNLLFTGDFAGELIHAQFGGIRIESVEGSKIIVSAGAGVVWDSLVEWTVEKGFSGLENLSHIPGETGATPVQNIGAYGVEVKQNIEKVEAVSTADGSLHYFDQKECGFGYRYSIFKGSEKGKFLVTRVFFNLTTLPSFNLDYGMLREEVLKIGDISPINVRKAVISIRQSKLPDPEIMGNAGSFFKNPVVADSFGGELLKKFPGMPYYTEGPGMIKIPAAWLIDQCGWKGRRAGDAGVHEKQALIIVNYGNANGKEIFDLSEAIRNSVEVKFGISLEREVEVIDSI
jgi:UDP-N-acetylmuramate dehydrogenase